MRKHNDDDDNVDDDDDDDEDGNNDNDNDDDNNDYVYFDNEENGTDVIHHSELSKEMKIATLMPVMLILYNFIFHRRSLKSLSEWRHFRTAST